MGNLFSSDNPTIHQSDLQDALKKYDNIDSSQGLEIKNMKLSQQALQNQFQTLPFSSATTFMPNSSTYCTRLADNSLSCFQNVSVTAPTDITFKNETTTFGTTTFYYKRLSPNIIIGSVVAGSLGLPTLVQYCVTYKDSNKAAHAIYYSKNTSFLDQLMLSTNTLQFNTTYDMLKKDIIVAVILNTTESVENPVFTINTTHDEELSTDDKTAILTGYTTYFNAACVSSTTNTPSTPANPPQYLRYRH
jgi:hypothetical protein